MPGRSSYTFRSAGVVTEAEIAGIGIGPARLGESPRAGVTDVLGGGGKRAGAEGIAPGVAEV